ncbi:MAG TPA: alkaline phosphatase family protein [Candidatus Angelobacter sp.]|nr:alkaline phosphatase family protein [Candidatus Angelobacter sp.]
MRCSTFQNVRTTRHAGGVILLSCAIILLSDLRALGGQLTNVETVFLIVMENHDWASVYGNTDCACINETLLPMASHAEQYFTPSGLHPSEPNYLWLEAGTNFGIFNDALPAENRISTPNHLTSLLEHAGVSWKTYQESLDAGDSPLTDHSPYVARHDPFVFFDDIATNDARRASHVRPYSELASDLQQGTVARYNFIVPNITNDMHSLASGGHSLQKQGDDWLARETPMILSSENYAKNGALFILWDEGDNETSDGPIGLILLSPLAKGRGYASNIRYTHSSLLRTLQEIFDVRPFLGDAADATDLDDLFADDQPLAVSLHFTNDLPQLTFTGLTTGKTNKIQISTNLFDWLTLSTNIMTSNSLSFIDVTATNDSRRFYRVLEFR